MPLPGQDPREHEQPVYQFPSLRFLTPQELSTLTQQVIAEHDRRAHPRTPRSRT